MESSYRLGVRDQGGIDWSDRFRQMLRRSTAMACRRAVPCPARICLQ